MPAQKKKSSTKKAFGHFTDKDGIKKPYYHLEYKEGLKKAYLKSGTLYRPCRYKKQCDQKRGALKIRIERYNAPPKKRQASTKISSKKTPTKKSTIKKESKKSKEMKCTSFPRHFRLALNWFTKWYDPQTKIVLSDHMLNPEQLRLFNYRHNEKFKKDKNPCFDKYYPVKIEHLLLFGDNMLYHNPTIYDPEEEAWKKFGLPKRWIDYFDERYAEETKNNGVPIGIMDYTFDHGKISEKKNKGKGYSTQREKLHTFKKDPDIPYAVYSYIEKVWLKRKEIFG